MDIPQFTYDSQIFDGFCNEEGDLIIDSNGNVNVVNKELYNQYLLEYINGGSKKILKAKLIDGAKLILSATGTDGTNNSRSILYTKNTKLNAGDSIELKSTWETDTYRFAGYIDSTSKDLIVDSKVN